MGLDAWRTFLGRNVAELQRRLHGDLRLVACGVSRIGGGCVLWLDCEGLGSRRVPAGAWRGRARLAGPLAASADDPSARRRARLALAEALADIAARSGRGVGLWRAEGGTGAARRSGSRSARASSPGGG